MVFVCRIFTFSLRISVFQKCLIQHFKKLNWPTFCHIKTKNVYEAHFCWDFIQSNALCEIETKTFIVVQIQKWTLMVYLSVATFSSWSFPPFFSISPTDSLLDLLNLLDFDWAISINCKVNICHLHVFFQDCPLYSFLHLEAIMLPRTLLLLMDCCSIPFPPHKSCCIQRVKILKFYNLLLR